MASVGGGTPARELTDSELRKRLLALGYDVPVSVNREFLVRKLENASATAVGGGGGGGKSNKRHSLAVTPSSSPAGSPTTARKRKSMAATPRDSSSGSGSRGRGSQHQNNVNSPPISPYSTPSPPQPQGTPQYGSPGMSSMGTPATPPLSPFVSRLGSPSTPPNGEMGNPSPRFLNYYNMFKASPSMGGGDGGHGSPRSGDPGSGYGYAYNRSIRLSAPPGGFSPVSSVAPPSKSDRNGYAGAAAGGGTGVESDWCGGIFISKVLVGLFVSFFLVIGVLYVRQSMIVDPRGLTGEVRSGEANEGKQSQPPPPVKKPAPVPPISTSMTYPICGLPGIDPEACIPKEIVKNSRALFNTLKDELTQRARQKGCYSDVQEIVSLQDAKSALHKLTDLKKGDVEAAFHGMLLLIIENPRGGLSLQTEAVAAASDLTPKDAAKLDINLTKVFATDVHPSFMCEMLTLLTSFTIYISVAIGTGGLVYGGYIGVVYYKNRKKLEDEEIFQIVESVTELLRKQYELAQATDEISYLAVNHVRDELMPPQERQKKEALWNKVVDYISNHESRIREEIQHISGEEFKVWRWLPSASPRVSPIPNRYSMSSTQQQTRMGRYSMPAQSSTPILPSASRATAGPSIPKSIYPNLNEIGSEDDDEILAGGPAGDTNSNTKWQGQAFETCEGSPNALPTTPTTCLKIRHMFSERDNTVRRSRIEQEILGKCCNAKILHIGMDPSSLEGCVYIRCLSKDDARKAFMSLHGWWFDGHLLSVKFLKEERYFSRFPEAKNSTVPMGLSR